MVADGFFGGDVKCPRTELVAPGKLHPTLWSAALLADPSNLALIAVAHAEFLAAGVDVIETVGYQVRRQ